MTLFRPFRAAAALLVGASLFSVPALGAQRALQINGVDHRVYRTSREITLDGRFTEPEWAQADSIADFRQKDPVEGAPGTERTVVRLLATPTGLAIGWSCYDRDAANIVRSQVRRDAELRSDDYVSMGIDGLHDKRSAFYFRSNANGAMWDGEHVDIETGNESWRFKSRETA